MKTIRDLLYLDFAKAASICSQLEGGLPAKTDVTQDLEKNRDAGVKFGIPKLAEANLSVDYVEKRSTLQSRTLHHNVLSLVETGLKELGLVTELSDALPSDEASPESVRFALGNRPYVIAQGQCVIEDYRRIVAMTGRYTELMDFIAHCQTDTVKKSLAYQQGKAAVEAARQAAKAIKDRNARAVQVSKIQEQDKALDQLAIRKTDGPASWLLEGIRMFIDTFMASRINFRVFPFESCPSFQLLCNLKTDCFVDADFEHMLYSYGNRPDVPLAIFGLITSSPQPNAKAFDPLQDLAEATGLTPHGSFEKSFRAIFPALDELSAFMRYSRYPNVIVHPIAVFRSFSALAMNRTPAH
jgi:hypothetical protein